jgi:hypothetical protein
MTRFFRHFAILMVLVSAPLAQGEGKRIRLVPRLQPGQSFDYLLDFQSDREIKTESSVVTPNLPAGHKISVLDRIHVVVVGGDGASFRLRTLLQQSPYSASGAAREEKPSTEAGSAFAVEFTLHNNGAVGQIKGLDGLPSDQQAAWREWVARFAASMTYPPRGLRSGDKWQTQEPETAPAPIARLVWRKKFEYVRDEPCPVGRTTARGDLTEAIKGSEMCAVILTTAVLTQKSSRKDATPEDYKLNHLRTKGTAAGTNETILYISRLTGLLMRSAETATQSMDVTISLADGSNQVHYTVNATSRARLLFLQPASPPAR